MDKKKGLLNVFVSIVFKFLLLAGNILVRRFLILYIGNEINGLNSLYISILDVLSVAELGVGTAITFCMYEPIVNGDNKTVSSLYRLFTKLYLIIGAIIFAGGLIVMPFLPYLAKDYTLDINLYWTFLLMLISICITYFFGAKTSLINAYKNNYITAIISSGGKIVEYALQLLVLFLTKSFIWFLACRIVSSLLQWLATEIVARKNYSFILNTREKISPEEKRKVSLNVRAMFMHKIGYAFVNTSDSIIISAFIGVVVLGKYSNYTTIMTAMTSVLNLFFTPLVSVIGHMYVKESKDKTRKYFNFFHSLNFVLGLVFFLGYYAVIDDLIGILFGEDLELSKQISFVITLNYFIQFMEMSVRLFKDSTGLFYYDRWKCIFEALTNIVLSIVFVLVFPDDFKVVGVIVATIITNLLICHTVEPHVLYKYGFGMRATNYYVRNYIYIIIFILALFFLNFVILDIENRWIDLVVNGFISVGFSVVISVIVILSNKDFRYEITLRFHKFLSRIRSRQN